MIDERTENKQRPWLELTLIGFIIILIVLIIFFSLNSNNLKFKSVFSNGHNSTTEIKNTEFDDIKMVTETSNNSSISYKISYPKTNFKPFNENVKNYIDESKELYMKTIDQKQNKTGHLNINFSIYPYKNYYSIIFTNVITYDYTKYNLQYHTYLIDKNNGNIISLNKILDDDVNHFTLLSNYVQKQLLKSKELKNKKIDKKTIINFTKPTWKNYSHFSIKDNQLVLYFNIKENDSVGTINPTVKISIPYLNPIIVEDFQLNKKSKTNIVSDYRKNIKRVALTFDDGPHATVTKQILATLDKYDAKATFFVVGTQVKKNKNILKQIKNKGHEIGNHTLNHKKLTKLKAKQILREINTANNLIKEAIGEEPTVFRPPYGSTNKKINKMSKAPCVLWTVDTLDWKYRNSKKLLSVVKNNVHNNAIILMHDIHQSTADGLDSVLKYLKKQGYEFVTVSELLSEK